MASESTPKAPIKEPKTLRAESMDTGQAPANEVVAETRNLFRKLGGGGGVEQTILRDLSLSVTRGELLALTGASGSGKSTLLYLLGVLDRPTSGEIWIDGIEVSGLDDDERSAFRNERLGFVFQFHFLLPEFSVLENVVLPMRRRGTLSTEEAEEHAYNVLDLLGLAELWSRKPGQLSGGQQQRVSIARAVANDPLLILADEPTGNLDSKNADTAFQVFEELVHKQHRTVIMVTHDLNLAERCDRQVILRDGMIVDDISQRIQ
jgi:lipoprotein-releasing system ATP-binding protein